MTSRTFDWHKAARDYKAGWSLDDTAELHGVTRHAVMWALRQLGVPTRKVGPVRSQRADEYVWFWENGFSIKPIADAYNVSIAAVHQALRRRGAIGPKRIPSDLDEEALNVFLDAYPITWEHTVAGALALAYEDMAERGVRRARG
jgi:hypothetical protein